MEHRALISIVATAIAAAVSLSCGGSTGPAAHPQINYLVLGDSYGFGYTTPTNTGIGNGAPSGGYYAPVAGFLASKYGATANVINLAIPGETTYSFTGSGDPYLPFPIVHTIADNTNYATQITQAGELGSLTGAKPSFVTLQIGGNDIIQYLYESLYVENMTPTAIASSLPTVIAASMANYASIIAEVKAHAAPNATILLVDYADPFVALSSTKNPTALGLDGLDVQATQEFDAALQTLAAQSGVGFVDIVSAFSTNTASSNYIGNYFSINDPTANTAIGTAAIPDYHPNSAGYAVIAQQVENAISSH